MTPTVIQVSVTGVNSKTRLIPRTIFESSRFQPSWSATGRNRVTSLLKVSFEFLLVAAEPDDQERDEVQHQSADDAFGRQQSHDRPVAKQSATGHLRRVVRRARQLRCADDEVTAPQAPPRLAGRSAHVQTFAQVRLVGCERLVPVPAACPQAPVHLWRVAGTRPHASRCAREFLGFGPPRRVVDGSTSGRSGLFGRKYGVGIARAESSQRQALVTGRYAVRGRTHPLLAPGDWTLPSPHGQTGQSVSKFAYCEY